MSPESWLALLCAALIAITPAAAVYAEPPQAPTLTLGAGPKLPPSLGPLFSQLAERAAVSASQATASPHTTLRVAGLSSSGGGSSSRHGQQVPAAGGTGYDISWPQCGAMPELTTFDFAIVGVTDGKALTTNSCFVEQYSWASRGGTEPAVYMNVNGLPGGWTSPTCPSADGDCEAYAYGRAAADAAVAYAEISGVFPKSWWLDVETENAWSGDLLENAFVLRGAIEALHAHGLWVGVYSTPYQWAQIAGDYSPGLDVWTAGASDAAEAAGRCEGDTYAFNGGRVRLVQYVAGNIDTNFACD